MIIMNLFIPYHLDIITAPLDMMLIYKDIFRYTKYIFINHIIILSVICDIHNIVIGTLGSAKIQKHSNKKMLVDIIFYPLKVVHH